MPLALVPNPKPRCRHRPREAFLSPLWRVLTDHLEPFLSTYDSRFRHTYGPLKPYVEKTFGALQLCGDPNHGVTRYLRGLRDPEGCQLVPVDRNLPLVREAESRGDRSQSSGTSARGASWPCRNHDTPQGWFAPPEPTRPQALPQDSSHHCSSPPPSDGAADLDEQTPKE